MDKDRIKELVKTLKSDFEEVISTAWDNCPDADEEARGEFEETVDSAEAEFDDAYNAVMKLLG